MRLENNNCLHVDADICACAPIHTRIKNRRLIMVGNASQSWVSIRTWAWVPGMHVKVWPGGAHLEPHHLKDGAY